MAKDGSTDFLSWQWVEDDNCLFIKRFNSDLT